MNKKIKIEIAVGIIAVVAIVVGVAVWKENREIKFETPKVAIEKKVGGTVCTMEAKLCANGSYVSRTGPNCEFAACPEVKKDETADWKTYRNDKYGFTFQYPNKLVIDPKSDDNSIWVSGGYDEFGQLGQDHYTISIQSNLNNISLEKFLSNHDINLKNSTIKDIEIDNRSAKRYWKDSVFSTGVAVKLNNNIVFINGGDWDDKPYVSFETFLATFKFTK